MIGKTEALKEYRSKTPRPIQQFIYQLSKEAERIKSEDPCRSEISSDDTYSVAYQIVRRIWDSQKAWNKHWLILPGEIWDKEEELTGAQSGSENVTDPDNAQINNNNETKEDLPEAIHHHPGASGTNSVPSPLSAHICPAELNSTNIAASLSSTTSSQAPPGRKFGKEAVSPMSRKELCEGLQRSHKANSTPSISTRSGKDIHSRRPSSPVSSEDKGGSATPIHPRILRSASSPSAKLREMPSRILKRKRA